MVIVIFGLYFLGFLLFPVYDSLVGFGDVEFNGFELPPLWLAALVWPITLPCLLVYFYVNLLSSFKDKRINKQQEAKKLRIALDKEAEIVLAQLEQEMEYEGKGQNSTKHY